MTMTLISTTNITAGATSVTVSSLPQTFDDLLIVASMRSESGSGTYVRMRFNGSTSNYSARTVYGSGQTVANTTYVDSGWTFRNVLATQTADTNNNISVYIPNYRLAVAKSGSADNVTENNATTASQEIHAWLWNDTAAITSIELSPSFAGFYYNCNFSIYGITKGSGGATIS